MAYDKNKNYQEEINNAVLKGDYATASTLELERNEKIEKENLSFEKTNNYTMPNGVSGSTWNTAHETYKPSDNVSSLDNKTNNALTNVENIASQQIISDSALKGMNAQFQIPAAVSQADAWLSQQLQKIQSGKTSYSDDVRNMMDKIMNREKFTYDVDADPLFQQALASAMSSGKQAMQDTIGQASALTGGYGSSYATSAGNQAYNSFIEDAYDNLPQYYQMALEAYQMEGDEMYRQFGMLSELDDKEFNRNVTAYDATYQHRNRMYDESYQLHRDGVNDSFAMANLQINEHGQRMNDAYNLYNATSNQADKMYEREYTAWADKINMAWKEIEMLNTDWWNQKNMDFQDEWNQKNYDQTEDHFTRGQEFQASESQKQRDWQSSESQIQRDWQSSEAEKDRNFTASENAKNRAASASKGGGGGGSGSGGSGKTPTESQYKKALDAYNAEGMDGLNKYLNSVSDSYNKEAIAAYVGEYGGLPYSQRTYTVVDDGGINGGWGVDNNAVVKDQFGNQYTLEELAKHDKSIAKELSKSKYTVGSSYTKK